MSESLSSALQLFSLAAVFTGSSAVYALALRKWRLGQPLVAYSYRADTDPGGVLSWLRKSVATSNDVATISPSPSDIAGRVAHDIELGIGAFLLAFPPVIALHLLIQHYIPYKHDLIEKLLADRSWTTFAAIAFSAAVLVPFYEEFLFRNLLQGLLQVLERRAAKQLGRENRWIFGASPIVISSAAFAAAHIGQGAAPIPLFLFALVLGYLYFRTNRLMPSIVTHMALNGFTVLQFLFVAPESLPTNPVERPIEQSVNEGLGMSKKSKFGFGIIGSGMIAGFHARAIADIKGASLIGCYDRIPQAAQNFAANNNCTAYLELDEMLANPDIDIVTICTPSGSHMEPALEVAKARKHVIVEKPLEITLKRCDKMIDTCAKYGVTLASIFPSRFHRSALALKQAADAKRFGKLTLAEAYVKWFRTQAYYDSGAWRGTWELDGGGALMNQAIHSVDLLTWLMGPVVEIQAHTATLAHERIAVEDTAVATLKFENGALGVIEASTAVFPGYLKRVELHGSEGSAAMEEEDIVTWDFAKSAKSDAAIKKQMGERISTAGGASDPKAIGHHGHAALFRNVIGALQGKEKLLCDGTEGRRSVEIILAIYKAAETGKTIKLPLASDPVLAARKRKA